MNWKVSLFEPDFQDSDLEAVKGPIQDRWLTMGARTQAFEQAFAHRIGARHAVAVSSGTAALHLAVLALNPNPGDEIITPTLTFVACANVIVAAQARPVFADITSEEDWTVSPDDLRRRITEHTRALMVVHYAGFPCRMQEILAIARERKLTVIEDCAHALVSSREGTYCGTFGDLGCFSFFSNKNMTTGEGGMVTTHDDELAERVRLLRSHGMTTLTLDRYQGRAVSYDVRAFGLNYRPSEITSALGISQLDRLNKNLERRRELYDIFVDSLREIPGISLPFLRRSREEVGYHIFPILLEKNIRRDKFIQSMKDCGVQTSIHYPPIHTFTAYRELLGNPDADCPLSEEIGTRQVTLPFYPSMREEQIRWVCDSVRKSLCG